MSGFYPVLSEEEKKKLDSYAKELEEELLRLYSLSQGEYVLKPSFAPAYDQLEKSSDTFKTGVDALNREIERWLEN